MLENWLQFQIICVQNAVKISNWCSSVRVLRTPSPTYRIMDYENLLKLKQSPLCNILNLFLTIERGSIHPNDQSLNKNWEGEAVNEKVWANDWYACMILPGHLFAKSTSYCQTLRNYRALNWITHQSVVWCIVIAHFNSSSASWIPTTQTNWLFFWIYTSSTETNLNIRV